MLYATMARYRDVLEARRDDINSINVFPIADRDTGSNLLHTMVSVTQGLDPAAALADAAAEVAAAAVFAGRGASGLIMSQAITGMARRLEQSATAGAGEVADALQAANEAARRALADPVEGTIITCARRVAEAAQWSAGRGSNLAGVTSAARDEAWAAVSETPTMLPVLAEAGVVDGGAVGYALLLDVLDAVVRGTEVPEAHIAAPGSLAVALPDDRYELIVNLENVADPTGLAEAWQALGSSVALASQAADVRAHIHTADVAGAYRTALRFGEASRVEMTDLHAYAGDGARRLTVLVASLPEQAGALLSLGPTRLLLPADIPSLVHIVETSAGHDLRFVVVGDGAGLVETARAATSGEFVIEVVADAGDAAALV